MTLYLGLGKKKSLPVYFLLWVRKLGKQENILNKDGIYWDFWLSIQMTCLHLAKPCMFTTTLMLEKVCLPSALGTVHTPRGALGLAPGL